MSITQNGFTFGGSDLHGDIVPEGNWEPEFVTEKFFAVQGESHLIGAPGGRLLRCEYFLTGYVSSILLGNALQTIAAQITQLTGAVTLGGLSNNGGTFNACTFLGYHHGPRFFDGSGVNGWCVSGTLLWRQRNP